MSDNDTDITGSWKFNAQVAEQFDHIARREIPDYQRVIDLCIALIQKEQKPNPSIIDVGSATGHTLHCLYEAGFRNLYGVDSSADMLARSFAHATLIQSEHFPVEQGPYDYVLANWVLHFIPERKAYIAEIKSALADNGALLLTEKSHRAVQSMNCITTSSAARASAKKTSSANTSN